jgi:hypothetical protein
MQKPIKNEALPLSNEFIKLKQRYKKQLYNKRKEQLQALNIDP